MHNKLNPWALAFNVLSSRTIELEQRGKKNADVCCCKVEEGKARNECPKTRAEHYMLHLFFMQKTMLKAAERNTSINHEKDFKDFNCSAPS